MNNTNRCTRLSMFWSIASVMAVIFILVATPCASIQADDRYGGEREVLPPLNVRFAPQADGEPATDEVPNFQKHVTPLFGRLGCNGRACHGSFQGQGGFRLSLFGYDFQSDYDALLEEGAGRVDLDDKLESLILTKPTDADMHEGGKRYEKGQWEYWVFRRWIEAGAPFDRREIRKLERLEVTPTEIQFGKPGHTQQLRVVAVWEDGIAEDVTCLCRFYSNDDVIATVDQDGLVKAGQPGDTHVVVAYDNAVVPIPVLQPVSDLAGNRYPEIPYRTEIDRLVLNKLRKLGILPSPICSDEEFLRRASLDVTGTLPSPAEVLAFVNDPSPDKRARKLEELLQRPAYAARWATFLCDITGNNSDQLRNFLPNTARPDNQWYEWLYRRVADNVPYDEIVAGIVMAESRKPGESYREYCEAMSEICRDPSGRKFADRPGLVHYWARNNFRTPEDRAIGIAYSFLGIRIQCAQCHKHPFDQWSKEDFDSFKELFRTVQANAGTLSPEARQESRKMLAELGVDENLRGNNLRRQLGELLKKGKTVPMPELVVSPARGGGKGKDKDKQGNVPQAKLLGGDVVALDVKDPRARFMEWLREPNNPYFSRALVNRVWAEYFGVGIVDPPDDLSLANAPSNAELLAYLERGFIESGYDLKWLHRQIVLSDTYQRSWKTNETNATDRRNFSHHLLRRLPAEATYDAVRMALANDDYRKKMAALEVSRAYTIAGSSTRNNRNPESYALTLFGRNVRESNCDCDRTSEPSLLQTVFLMNDPVVYTWLRDPKTSWVKQVADKYGWKPPRSAPTVSPDFQRRARQQIAAMRKQLDAVRERLVEAEKNNKQALVKQLKARISSIENQIRNIAAKAQIDDADQQDRQAESNGWSEEQLRWVIEQAYLRTLSRLPTNEEFRLASDHLRGAKSPVTAVEDLLWSLINTKEFILNH